MSSETSTDARGLASRSASGQTPSAEAGFQAWQLFTLAALVCASVVAFLARSRPSSVRLALILTVFGAAAIGVAALRMLRPFTRAAAQNEPVIIGGRTRAALEREKALALRSIKELEFDRAMGKVSEKDFAEMSTRLRARAARILRELDAGAGYKEQIEREIAERLGPEAAVRPAAPPPAPAAVAGRCTECGTGNDADARFCKACGHRMVSA